MSRVRIGVVGLGGIAQTAHLPLLRRLDIIGLRLTEAADALQDGVVKRSM